jgi:uncharacterized cupredoxin-like copper-binding protein
VPAGRVLLQMRNIGEDDHDLVVRTAAGRVVAAMPDVRPGRTGQLRATLRPGRYTLVCRITGHEGAGMTTTIRVVRPAARR